MKVLPIIFSYQTLCEEYPNKDTFYSFLARNIKNGRIYQIKKGIYALVDPSTGTVFANKFQIASSLFNDSYFSYHEALEYYGLATQSYISKFTYLSHVRVNPFEFNDIVYESKVRVCDIEIVDSIKENGVRVVSLERAIIDSIDNYKLAGGLEEVELALEVCPELDINKIINLLEFYNKSSLYQKVGYLFEKHFGNYISQEFLNLCLSKVRKKKIYLDCKPGNTILISKWNILIKNTGELPNELF